MSETRESGASSPAPALLGEIVTWDMKSMEVPFAKVQEALFDARLDPTAATDLRAVTAFRRAVKEYKDGRTIDKVSSDKDSGVVSFQFTRKYLEATGVLEFAYETTVHLDTLDGRITCDDAQIEEHARELFAHAQGHRTTSDITRLVQRMFEAQADLYPINPKKGVAYFVPECHRDFSEKIEQFLDSLGGRLLRFPVPKGTPEGNRSVKEAVEEGLQALADELEHAIADWTTSTRESTFEKALERWKVIEHKAKAYSEYLGERQGDLLERLDGTKRAIAQRVMDLTAEKEGTPTAEKEGTPTAAAA